MIYNYTSQLSKLKKTFDHKKKTLKRLAQTNDPTEYDWYEMKKNLNGRAESQRGCLQE